VSITLQSTGMFTKVGTIKTVAPADDRPGQTIKTSAQ
jgi:hypothetical protein